MTRRASFSKDMSPPRSDCPIACTLDLIGDRWTLLVVRDLLKGKRRFSEFLGSDEGIKTNILTDRLKRLERSGLVKRSRYQEHPPRYDYHLTAEGGSLSPVVKAIFAWGRAHLPTAAAAHGARRAFRR